MMDVIVRGLDTSLYRRLKARAALMGMKVSSAMQEAIDRWLTETGKAVETELDADNEAYERMRGRLQREHAGKYTVFHSGAFLGAAPTLKEAGLLARRANAKRVLMFRVGGEEPARGEWLWSSIELSTA